MQYDFSSFKKWLNFLRYMPIQDREVQTSLVDNHIEEMMQLSTFNKSVLFECVKEFMKVKIMTAGNFSENPELVQLTKQDSLTNQKF